MDTLIPDLPGFDSETALKLLGNNKKLYVTVLQRFYSQYSGSNYEKLSNLLLAGDDLAGIQREAHTIKGLAGTIGHPALQQLATELESIAKDTSDIGEIRAKSKEFLELFSTVLCQLGMTFPA